jgi:hypothetical protein
VSGRQSRRFGFAPPNSWGGSFPSVINHRKLLANLCQCPRWTFLHGIFYALYVRRSCIQGEISGFSEFANGIPPFFAIQPFSHKTTRSDCIEGFGLLTVRRVRHITSLSWCPETADNRRGAKLPETPANIDFGSRKPPPTCLTRVRGRHIMAPPSNWTQKSSDALKQ